MNNLYTQLGCEQMSIQEWIELELNTRQLLDELEIDQLFVQLFPYLET